MRNITVISMITMDGVMQAPGGPEEDRSGGFEFGGWAAPFDDEVAAKYMERLMKPADLLLGRKTFDIFENYWPAHADSWPGINEVTKYVLSNTRDKSNWNNSEFISTPEQIRELKNQEGTDLKVWGSSQLIRLLMQQDLIDELILVIHPITLGQGIRLFQEGTVPYAFSIKESVVTPKGVIIANYQRAGDVVTGTIGE